MRKITLGLVATAAIAASHRLRLCGHRRTRWIPERTAADGPRHLWFQERLGAAQTPYLFRTVQLHRRGFTPTGTWLFPYEVTIISDA